jgi:undecaprenyl-diphosphatase
VVLAAVFLLPALEASALVGLVIPGETTVVIGGVVAHGGALPLWAVITAAATGAAIGDQVGFLVGRRYGAGLLERLPERLRRSGDLDRALALVRRRGAVAVVVGRWAAALRALVPGVAGASGMNRTAFALANVVGGTAWAAAVATGGFLAGLSYHALERQLGLVGEVAAGALLVGALVWLVHARRVRRRAFPHD